jgi:hypothetical protein
MGISVEKAIRPPWHAAWFHSSPKRYSIRFIMLGLCDWVRAVVAHQSATFWLLPFLLPDHTAQDRTRQHGEKAISLGNVVFIPTSSPHLGRLEKHRFSILIVALIERNEGANGEGDLKDAVTSSIENGRPVLAFDDSDRIRVTKAICLVPRNTDSIS